ncbi:MAG: nitroreductase family protein [Deltaproteobacteria bacterium]|nr:nitroreductase family protein [Deltaproteobacteria bacterium]
MDVLAAIKNRRSIRGFIDREIPKEAVDILKDALIWAPSAGNLQSRRFYFVFNDEVKRDIVNAALRQTFIAQAPLVVVACADLLIGRSYGRRGEELYCIQDVACSVENMMLAAHSLGLGSVWVGAFHEDGIAKALNTPSNLRPVAIVPVGYPGHHPPPPRRLDKDEVVMEVR